MAQPPNELQGAPGQGFGAMANPGYFNAAPLANTLVAMRNSKPAPNNAFPDPVDNPEAGPVTRFVRNPDPQLGVPGADKNVPIFNGSWVTDGQGNRGSADMQAGDGHADTNVPPRTPAQDAASAAAMKALDAKYGASDQDQVSRGVANGRLAARPAVDPNANVSAWNQHVASVTQALENLGIKNAGQVLAQPMPSYDKASGEAALQTTDGATKLLNYGYGSTIVGQGKSASGKLNDFRGVGGGAAPAGAAGVFGAPAAAGGTPFDQMHAHLLGLSQQAQQKMAAGDQLGAKRIEGHMQKLASIFQTLGTREYQQGELGQQGRRTALAENIANPKIANDLLISALLQNNDDNTARRKKAASEGQNLDPIVQVGMGTYGVSPNTGSSQFYMPDKETLSRIMGK